MSWHTPERKTEQALKNYFLTVSGEEFHRLGVADEAWLTRFCNQVETEPRVEIICADCDPQEAESSYNSGNWLCEVSIRIISHYERGVDSQNHDEIAGEILDKILVKDSDGNDSFIDNLNASQVDADFKGLAFVLGSRSNRPDGHSIITEQKIKILMCPSKG